MGTLGAPQLTGPALRPGQPRCLDCPIRLQAVCAQADEGELRELERIKRYRTYPAGQTIASSGDAPAFVGSVVDGIALISTLLPDGRRQTVGLLLPSDFVGRPGRSHIEYDIVAATPVTLCMFHKPEFERLLHRNPRIERRLLEMTLDELDAAREWMLLLGRKTARERVASLLLMVARRNAALSGALPYDGQTIPLRLTRQEIADYLGLTVETVSRQISALRREGVLALHPSQRIEVRSVSRLTEASGDAA
jgi:CRP/FNR family transcriptional regulator